MPTARTGMCTLLYLYALSCCVPRSFLHILEYLILTRPLLVFGDVRKVAFGHDDLQPVSLTFNDGRNGWGATIVDGMPTMFIMGLDVRMFMRLTYLQMSYPPTYYRTSSTKQLTLAPISTLAVPRRLILSGLFIFSASRPGFRLLIYGHTMFRSVFETTIRYVGGLLSSFELSGSQHQVLVDKAKEVVDKMAFAWVGVSSVLFSAPQVWDLYRPC